VPDAALLAFLEVDELLVDVSSLSGVDLKQAMHAVHNTHTHNHVKPSNPLLLSKRNYRLVMTW
jgi:hypothetical protein